LPDFLRLLRGLPFVFRVSQAASTKTFSQEI
jgi:hypothetical protein